jgi:hypothetical protein
LIEHVKKPLDDTYDYTTDLPLPNDLPKEDEGFEEECEGEECEDEECEGEDCPEDPCDPDDGCEVGEDDGAVKIGATLFGITMMLFSMI